MYTVLCYGSHDFPTKNFQLHSIVYRVILILCILTIADTTSVPGGHPPGHGARLLLHHLPDLPLQGRLPGRAGLDAPHLVPRSERGRPLGLREALPPLSAARGRRPKSEQLQRVHRGRPNRNLKE